jgi:hypothetical protein
MRVRYQRGYLRLGQRKKGPDRWEFLWWDSESTGVRVRRKAVIGTVLRIQIWKMLGRQVMACACRSMRLGIASVNRLLRSSTNQPSRKRLSPMKPT